MADALADDRDRRSPGSTKRTAWWRPVLLLVLVISALALARTFDVGEKLELLQEWIRGLGALGPLVFVLVYVGAVVAAVPGVVLTVMAGVLFGPVLGLVSVSVGSTTGACLAFLIGRYFARDATASWLQGSERFRKLDAMTEQHGAIIVALTRLVPVFPFNLLNYGFGLTRVRFWTYAFWSWLCMLPGTAVYVLGAAGVTEGLSEGRVPWGLVIVFAAILVGLVAVVRYARRKLRVREADAGASDAS